ncbi:MAG TPA: hypothetical protein VFF57_02490 [Hanamia sp.]|nr:hypothetical protein [Hanamia sp.]
MNYLEEWYSSLQEFKWKNALINDPHFRNLESLKNELSAFLPESDLTGSLQQNHDNWLLHILFDKQPNSIFILNEVAELLKYYKSIPGNEAYHLISKGGRINYKGLPERLFEIHVNYLLRSVGLNPEIGHTYQVGANTKEIDILFKFGNTVFNVEATKYYDAFSEELLSLTSEILWKLQAMPVKRTLTMDEIFSGYIGFKKRDDNVVKKSKQLFYDGTKSFIHGYRSVKNTTIQHPEKKETEDFVFHIEPTFTHNYEKEYDKVLEDLPGYIKFRIAVDLQANTYIATIRASTKSSIEDGNLRLVKKIKEKLAQHKHYQGKLMIFIAIEQVFSSFNNNRAIPIRQKNIDADAIHRVIRGKATVVLLFKELTRNGISYQKMILGNGLEYDDLFKLLLKIRPVIRYTPD